MKAVLCVATALTIFLLLWPLLRPPAPLPSDYYDIALYTGKNPLQEETSQKEFPVRISNGTMMLTPLAAYEITAVVLSKKRYYFDWSAEIAPFDFALGWKGMAKEYTRKTVRIRQRSRWYFFEIRGESPYTPEYVSRNSANTHVIPATENIRRALRRVKKDDIIKMAGFLISAHGFIRGKEVRWKSSLSREDTGDGACEILYVQRLYHEGRIYE